MDIIEMTTWHENGHDNNNNNMNSTKNKEKLDGSRMPICRQGEGRGGALLGLGPLGESSKDESPCHPNPDSACPARAEKQGDITAKNKERTTEGSEIELSPEWKSIHMDYGGGITSTPRVEVEKLDLTKNPGGRVQAPRVIEVKKINPEITEYLTRKRSRKQSMTREETTMTDASEEGSARETAKGGRKKKGKLEKGKADKLRIMELEEENKKLKERIADEGIDEEFQPDYSLLPNKKNLPTVEELQEEIRFEPHFAIEGIIVDCANRISKIANCSNNIRGRLVRKLRICARKVQAGSLQFASIIKEAGEANTAEKNRCMIGRRLR